MVSKKMKFDSDQFLIDEIRAGTCTDVPPDSNSKFWGKVPDDLVESFKAIREEGLLESVTPVANPPVIQPITIAEPRELHRDYDEGGTRLTSRIVDNARTRKTRDGEITIKCTATPAGLIPDTQADVRELTNTVIDAYVTILDIADGYGFQLKHAPGHPMALSNHIVLERKVPIKVPGLIIPNNMKTWQPVRMGGLSRFLRQIHEGIYQVVTSISERAGQNHEEQATIEISNPRGGGSFLVKLPPSSSIIDTVIDIGSADGKQIDQWDIQLRRKSTKALVGLVHDMELSTNRKLIAVGNLVSRLEDGTDAQAKKNSIAIGGASPEGLRWVPRLDWFDPKLSAIDDEQLLPLLSEAERSVFMTFLGRGLLGRKGTSIKTLKGYFTQNRKWRLFCIWEGRVGGLGRSTTLEYLADAFTYLGYSADAMDDPTGRFSQGKSAALDFGFIDDLDAQKTMNILGNSTFKTLTSGGTLVVEEKGQPSYVTTSQGIYMLATNKISPEKLSELDAGNISRIAAMRNRTGTCRESRAFVEKYGYPVHVDRGYAHLCDQYGVTPRTLTLLLLARCADRFLNYAHLPEQDLSMVDELCDRRKEFALKIDLDYCAGVLQAYAEMQQWADPSTQGSPGFDIKSFLNMLAYRASNDRKGIDGCNDTPGSIISYVADSLKYNRGLNKVTELFFSLIISNEGFSYPTELSFWNARWSEYRDSYDWDKEYHRLSPIFSKRTSELTEADQEDRKRIDGYRVAQSKGAS